MKVSVSSAPDIANGQTRFAGKRLLDAACPCRADWSVEHPADRSNWPDVLGYLSLSRCSATHKHRANSLGRFLHPGRPAGVLSLSWGKRLFPQAQSLLLVQWSTLVVAAPLMAVVLAEVGHKSRAIAFALLIPFLAFAIFPANVQTYTSYPGLDGFGIYNRQVSLLLYVLTCGLMFIADGRKLAAFCAITMLALFLTKITGFLVGGLFGLTALLAGRLSIKTALIAAAITLIGLATLELNGHMISAYLVDIEQLLILNEGALLPRF